MEPAESAAQPPQATTLVLSKRNAALVDIFALCAVGLLVRAAVLLVLPASAVSDDMHSWVKVIGLLKSGQNPYSTSTLLNWPPFWMQILYGLGRVSAALNTDPIRVIQAFLICVDLVTSGVLYVVLRHHAARHRAIVWSLLGFVVNPVAVILTCVGGNFDALVGLWVLLTVSFLIRWLTRRDPSDWLLAASGVGLGALTKTVPIVLVGLLVADIRRLSRRTVLLGSLLAIGPILLGMSVIYVLSPEGVTSNVIHYRSFAGYFGITGLMRVLSKQPTYGGYTSFFEVLLLLAALAVAIRVARASPPRPAVIVGCAAFLLLMVPALGPGYGPQYLAWTLPLLPLLYGLSGRSVRVAVVAFLVVATIIYTGEYAVVPDLGAYGKNVQLLAGFASFLTSGHNDVLWRLPLFAAYLALMVVIALSLTRRVQTDANPPDQTPEPAAATTGSRPAL